MPSVKITRDTAIGGVHMSAGTVVPGLDEKTAKYLIGIGKAIPVDEARKPIENREQDRKLTTKNSKSLKAVK